MEKRRNGKAKNKEPVAKEEEPIGIEEYQASAIPMPVLIVLIVAIFICLVMMIVDAFVTIGLGGVSLFHGVHVRPVGTVHEEL